MSVIEVSQSGCKVTITFDSESEAILYTPAIYALLLKSEDKNENKLRNLPNPFRLRRDIR